MQQGFIDEKWILLNWNKRQFLSDSSTERVRRHRGGLKQDETLQKQASGVTVTAPDTEQIQKHKKNQKKTAVAFTLPEWVPIVLWNAWVEHRRKMRKPLTEMAMSLAVKKLDRFRSQGYTPELILEAAVEGGWQGLFLPRNTGLPFGNSNPLSRMTFVNGGPK